MFRYVAAVSASQQDREMTWATSPASNRQEFFGIESDGHGGGLRRSGKSSESNDLDAIETGAQSDPTLVEPYFVLSRCSTPTAAVSSSRERRKSGFSAPRMSVRSARASVSALSLR